MATPHIDWLSGLRPSPNRILQCAASLAASGYDRPCGPIKSLFLLSPARCLIVRPYADSSELSYSYYILLHQFFSIESGPLLDNKALLYSSELSYSCIDHPLHHIFFSRVQKYGPQPLILDGSKLQSTTVFLNGSK